MYRSLVAITLLGNAAALKVATNGSIGDELSGGNLCMEGHLAPKYFLLGAPKSGTTYFFEDLGRSSGIVNYQPGPGEASWHAKEPWVFASKFNIDNKKAWLQHYPECTQDEHKVAVDCTPGYFGSEFAPFGIKKAYAGGHHDLVFMVFLRNPVDRSHSHYYQFLDNGVMDGVFAGCQPGQFPESFKDAVLKRMSPAASVCDCACDNMFEDSMYRFAFDRYLENFPGTSFHVVPFNMATTSEIVEYTWHILNVPQGTGERSNLVGGGNEMNHHEYPSLSEDLGDAQLEEKFKAWMDDMTGAKQLEKMLSGSGAHLYGIQEGESIADWLTTNW